MSDEESGDEVRVFGDWEEHWDDASNAYYFVNSSTNETTWERPEGFPEVDEGDVRNTEGEKYVEGDSGDGDYVDAESSEAEEEGEGREEGEEVVWEQHFDDDSELHYYVHPESGSTTWTRPNRFMSAVEDLEDQVGGGEEEQGLPPNWVAVVDDDSGEIFYHNEVTDETSWEFPEGGAERMEAVMEGEEEEDDENEKETAKKRKDSTPGNLSDATAAYVQANAKPKKSKEEKFMELTKKFQGRGNTNSPLPFLTGESSTDSATGGNSPQKEGRGDGGADASSNATSALAQPDGTKKDANSTAVSKAEELLRKSRSPDDSPKKDITDSANPETPTTGSPKESGKESPEPTSSQKKLKRHKSQYLMPEETTEDDKTIADKLQISPDHVANLRYLQRSVAKYVDFLKGETKHPPDLTFQDFKGPSLELTKFSAKGTEYPRRLSMFEQEISRQVRLIEEQSDELATPYLATKTARARVSVQDTPLPHRCYNYHPSSQLRLAQRERDEYSKAMSLHRAPAARDVKKINPKGFHPKSSNDPHEWIKAIGGLVAEKAGDKHVIGLLLDDKKAAICTNKEESVSDTYNKMDEMIGKAIEVSKKQRAEKVRMKESSDNLAKLREVRLDERWQRA